MAVAPAQFAPAASFFSARSIAFASASSGEVPAAVATGRVPDRTTAVQRLLQLLREASAM